MAGLVPAGIICEIMREDGTMARVPDLIEFCNTHAMKMLTVAEVIRYRMQHERYVHRVGEALVNTRYGEFRIIAYASEVEGGDSHLALVRGEIDDGNEPVLVRMHAHCLVGDVFGSAGCDCRATLEGAMEIIAAEGRGALIYLHQSARGFSVERVDNVSAYLRLVSYCYSSHSSSGKSHGHLRTGSHTLLHLGELEQAHPFVVPSSAYCSTDGGGVRRLHRESGRPDHRAASSHILERGRATGGPGHDHPRGPGRGDRDSRRDAAPAPVAGARRPGGRRTRPVRHAWRPRPVVDGSVVSCTVEPEALPAVLTAITAAGVRTLTSTPPTLEELFLDAYRGREPVR